MLVGRCEEEARLCAAVAAVLAGDGAALVLRGGAGVGKTVLLEAARAAAGGARVLDVRGVEAESGIPFAALRDLLVPLEDCIGDLPEPQQAALSGALALGPPVPGDRLAVLAATDGLLQAAAARAPTLALVDDAQWLDDPSLECLRFAARRVRGRLGLVFTVREPGQAAPAVPERLPREPGIEDVEVAPLGDAEARRLVDATAPGLAPPARAAILDAAAGNPLVLMRLPETLSPGQCAGTEAIAAPLAPGQALDGLFAHRVAALPQPARKALTVAAACEDGSLRAIVPACRVLALGPEELQTCERAGLVSLESDRLGFTHPLARGAAYHAASAEERRAAHAALADSSPGEARAWHLAHAAIGPDEHAAGALEQLAFAAGARRAYASAADALEYAARLSEQSPAFAARMLGAAQAGLAAGRPPQMIPMLDESELEVADAPARAQAAYLRGLMRLWSGDVPGGVALLESQAGAMAEIDPVQAAAMLADAAAGCTAVGDCRRSLEISERASALLGDGGDPATRVKVLAIHAWSLCLRGETRAARPVIDEIERVSEQVDPFSPSAPALVLALNARFPVEEYTSTLETSLRLVARARDAGGLGALPMLLVVSADAAYRLGHWEMVEEPCTEAIALSEQTDHPGGAHGQALVTRMRLYAAQGRERECETDVEAALALAAATGQRSGYVFTHAAQGFLRLGGGRVEAAIESLEAVERLAEELGYEEPTLIPWAPDLIEAYARAGRIEDAERALEVFSAVALRTESRWAAAAVARCEGILGRAPDAAFARSLALLDQLPLPFERARTLLAQGSVLQRSGRRADARAPLREALAAFEALGAAPWAQQARSSLLAAGGRRPRDERDGLTPQELRVARAAARGASTKEIAAELFLSPRTVESHLASAYRKLGIRSRRALPGALAQRAE